MRTRNTIWTQSESLKTQENPLNKAVRFALNEYSSREMNLVENPFAEYWIEIDTILALNNTSKAEETTYKLWKLFWVKSKEVREMIERDRMDEQVLSMLAQVWIRDLDLSKSEKRNEPLDFHLFAN